MKRRYIQVITALLYNCHLTGFVTGKIAQGPTKAVCVPGLNCYSCPGAVCACPLGSLQNAVARSHLRIPLYLLGTLILFGVLLGRVVCGFLCPFGLLQELLYLLPGPKLKKSPITRLLSYMKYLVLAVLVVGIPLVQMTPGFCKYLCPAGTLEAGLPLVLSNRVLQSKAGVLFSWKVFVLVLCLGACACCFRAFCRFLCPLGAIYSIFYPVACFGMRVDREKCTRCGACIAVCPMDIKEVGDRECIQCGACQEKCPHGAICRRR